MKKLGEQLKDVGLMVLGGSTVVGVIGLVLILIVLVGNYIMECQ